MQGAVVVAVLPGNENERAGSSFHSHPGRLGGAQGLAPAGPETRAPWARPLEGIGPARILLQTDSPSGILALAPRGTEVGSWGI